MNKLPKQPQNTPKSQKWRNNRYTKSQSTPEEKQ